VCALAIESFDFSLYRLPGLPRHRLSTHAGGGTVGRSPDQALKLRRQPQDPDEGLFQCEDVGDQLIGAMGHRSGGAVYGLAKEECDDFSKN
jgi:hypothetical protein